VKVWERNRGFLFTLKLGIWTRRVSCVRTVGGGQMSKLFGGTSTREAVNIICQIGFNLFEHFFSTLLIQTKKTNDAI